MQLEVFTPGPGSGHKALPSKLYDLMAPSFSRSFSTARRHTRRITLEHLLEHQSKPATDSSQQGLTTHDIQVISPIGQQQQVRPQLQDLVTNSELFLRTDLVHHISKSWTADFHRC